MPDLTCRDLVRGSAMLAAFVLTLSAVLLGSPAAAQDPTIQSKVEDLQQRYEEAAAAQDWEAMASLFTEDATMMPMEGGYIEGPVETRSYYEQSGIIRLDARSARTEIVGENILYDLGSFTATFSGEAGEMEAEGEYAALAKDGDNGLQLYSLVTFPTRKPLSAPAQE